MKANKKTFLEGDSPSLSFQFSNLYIFLSIRYKKTMAL